MCVLQARTKSALVILCSHIIFQFHKITCMQLFVRAQNMQYTH